MSITGKWSTQATVGLILVGVGLAAIAALLALSIPGGVPLRPGGSSVPTSQVPGVGLGADLGERIFLTGADEKGRLIPALGSLG